MNKLLLIMGDLATGKSTFANLLSQRYDTPLFVKDSIKEILGDTIGFSNREENLKLSQATGKLMSFIFTRFAEQKQDLILESNFRLAELEQLHQIAAEHNYQVLTLVLQGGCGDSAQAVLKPHAQRKPSPCPSLRAVQQL